LRCEVWCKRNGDFLLRKCYICRTDLHFKNFECGHIKAEAKGGKITIDNVEPICSNCNKTMQTMNLNDFINENYPERQNLEESFFGKYEQFCPLCNKIIVRGSMFEYDKISKDFYICVQNHLF
jgi:hypothetical protein